jgi:monoamine oxidase
LTAKVDAIVIGAGAAGLACARDLTGAGKRVCILEARDRIGGRIDTRRLSGIGVPIDLGAEFIHGETPTTFAIVDAAALNAVELPNDHWWSRNGQWERVDDFWGAMQKIRKPLAKLKRDISFDEFLRSRRNLTPRLRQMARNFVEGYHAAHADRISALALALSDEEQSGENRQFRIIDGYDAVMQWLLAGIDPTRSELCLNTVATDVQWSQGEVVVNEQFRASALVITIPIGVWKSGTLRFDPALAEKERVITKLDAGHVVKIVFRFREMWWPKGVSFVHTDDRLMPTWWTLAPLRAPILTGWAGGHAADALLAEPAAARIDRALDAMASAFSMKRTTLDDLLVAAYTHDWQADPFSRGAYSYALVGGSNAHRALAKPIAKTLFFAGEATNSEETGTVAGAIESGHRAAREVVSSRAS